MKKNFKKACVVLGIMGMGLGTASCSEELLNILLPIAIEAIQGNFGQNHGSQVAYTGTLTVASYKCENNQYDPDSKQNATVNVTVTATPDEKNGVVTLQIADFKVGDTTVSGFTFNTNYNADGVIGNGENAYYTGLTCTVNGKAAAEDDYACVCGKLTEGALELTYVDFYTAGKKFDCKFSGKVQQANSSNGSSNMAQ